MKELWVPKLEVSKEIHPQEMKNILEKEVPLVPVDVLNWEEFPYRPRVHFRIGHTGQAMYINFYVEESHVLARFENANSPTHKDSSVEFFIDVKENGEYYNIEVNPIGTVHLAYGTNVKQREFIDPFLIHSLMKIYSSIATNTVDNRQKPRQRSR